VYYSGHVQGVGFRFTSRDLAREFGVTGFVRNLDDGRVELLVEGEPSRVDGFLDAIRREMGAVIRDVSVSHEPAADPPLSDFSIRY
jgi:acylphosphatase